MRWRNRPAPVAVEDDVHGGTMEIEPGREVTDYNATWDDEMIGRFKAGYNCLRCWEPQERPFPGACSMCGYSMKAFQAEDFAKEFRGNKHIGPSTSLKEELDRLEAGKEQRIWTPGGTISVPRVPDA